MKDTKQLLKKLRKAGCQVTKTGSDHWRVTYDGEMVILPSTPSNGSRSLKNTKAMIWRYLGIRV